MAHPSFQASQEGETQAASLHAYHLQATLFTYTAKEAKYRAERQPVIGSAPTIFGRHFSSAPKSVTIQVIAELGLSVLAHAGDLTLGQCLFGDEDPLARLRPE
jgi:hypothetical protein